MLCMLQAAFSLEGDPWRAVCVFSLRCGCDAVGLVSSWAHVDVCVCACAKDAWLLWFVYTAAVRPVVEGSGSSGGDSTVVQCMHITVGHDRAKFTRLHATAALCATEASRVS